MVTGALTVFIWSSFGPEIFGQSLYEIVPGFLANVVVAVVVSKFTFTDNAALDREFDQAVELANELRARAYRCYVGAYLD